MKLKLKNGPLNKIGPNEGGVKSVTIPTASDSGKYGIVKCERTGSTITVYGGYYSDKGFNGALIILGDGTSDGNIYNGSFVAEFANGVIHSSGGLKIYDGYFYTESSKAMQIGVLDKIWSYCLTSTQNMDLYKGRFRGVAGGIGITAGSATIHYADVEVKERKSTTVNNAGYAILFQNQAGMAFTIEILDGVYASSGKAVAKIGTHSSETSIIETDSTIKGGVFKALPEIAGVKTKLFDLTNKSENKIELGKFFMDPSIDGTIDPKSKVTKVDDYYLVETNYDII